MSCKTFASRKASSFASEAASPFSAGVSRTKQLMSTFLSSPNSDKNSNDAELFLQKTRHDRRKAVLLFADAMQDQS